MVLLDTNVLVEYLAGRLDIRPRVHALGSSNCYVSSVVLYELIHGALRSYRLGEVSRVSKVLEDFARLPFDDACAHRSADVRHELEARGMRIGPHDIQIAGSALAKDLTLVTHNVREFSRVDGLRIEDWQAV